MKKLNKKGFTLIEVIVVLAILAIMAAMAIPTMNGFIKEAKDSQYIAEARSVYVAAQYVAVRDQVNGTTVDITDKYAQIQNIADVADDSVIYVKMDGNEKTKVTGVVYKRVDKTVTKYYAVDVDNTVSVHDSEAAAKGAIGITD